MFNGFHCREPVFHNGSRVLLLRRHIGFAHVHYHRISPVINCHAGRHLVYVVVNTFMPGQRRHYPLLSPLVNVICTVVRLLAAIVALLSQFRHRLQLVTSTLVPFAYVVVGWLIVVVIGAMPLSMPRTVIGYWNCHATPRHPPAWLVTGFHVTGRPGHWLRHCHWSLGTVLQLLSRLSLTPSASLVCINTVFWSLPTPFTLVVITSLSPRRRPHHAQFTSSSILVNSRPPEYHAHQWSLAIVITVITPAGHCFTNGLVVIGHIY